jgi:hypothetical protein
MKIGRIKSERLFDQKNLKWEEATTTTQFHKFDSIE